MVAERFVLLEMEVTKMVLADALDVVVNLLRSKMTK